MLLLLLSSATITYLLFLFIGGRDVSLLWVATAALSLEITFVIMLVHVYQVFFT